MNWLLSVGASWVVAILLRIDCQCLHDSVACHFCDLLSFCVGYQLVFEMNLYIEAF